jgi:hypothetical protein
MKKYISLFVFLSLFLTNGIIYAEDEEVENKVEDEARVEVEEKDKSGFKLMKEERKQEREKIKNEIELMKEKREQDKEKVKTEIDKAHEKFQNQMELKRVELKEKSIANREQLKEKLKTIKNEKKQNLVLNISDNIEKINIKATDRLGGLLEKIENALLNIKERADKAKADGSNVDEVYTLITKAEVSIAEARASISTQIGKTYKIEITNESTLKSTIQTIRDGFHQDIKIVQEKVKLAHEAVRATAKSLGMIINLNDDENTTGEEESSETTTITTSSATNE